MSLLWVYLSLASAVLFATKDILAKEFLEEKKVNPKDMVFHQYFLLLIFVLGLSILSLVFGIDDMIVDFISFLDFYWLYIFKALVIALSTYFYFSLLGKYDISEVSPLINLSPLFLVVLSFLFLSESISLVQFLGVLVMILATYTLEVTVHHHKKNMPYKHYLLNLSKKEIKFFVIVFILLISFSMAAILDKFILTEVSVYTNMFFTSFLILVGLFFYFLKEKRLRKSFEIFNLGHKIWLVSGLTILSNFLILFAIAIPGALVSLIVPLRRTSTLFSSFFGGILFHEKHLGKKMLAICLMLLGVIMIVWTGDIF